MVANLIVLHHEYIHWLIEERARINRADLEDIEFFEHGMKLDIPEKVYDDFESTGLNNIDFISSDFYKEVDDIAEMITNDI